MFGVANRTGASSRSLLQVLGVASPTVTHDSGVPADRGATRRS
jgi:hypothetical protein